MERGKSEVHAVRSMTGLHREKRIKKQDGKRKIRGTRSPQYDRTAPGETDKETGWKEENQRYTQSAV